MKVSYTITVFVLLLSCVAKTTFSYGQNSATTIGATSAVTDMVLPDLEFQLVSLDTILAIAKANSPLLKYDSMMINASETDIILAKRRWHNNLSAFANYSTGNQTFQIAGANAPAENQRNMLNGYRYGVNLNIPLSDFTTRKIRIKQEQAELDALEYEKEQTEDAVHRQVIKEYHDLIAAQKLLRIKSSSVETYRVLHQLAEKQFREGTTSIEDYASVSDMTYRSEADYEMAKANFKIQYQQFENLVGVKLTTLMKQK